MRNERPPRPHIGTTLHRATTLHELERMHRNDAALQVDALLDRVSQPEPVNFCSAHDDVPASVSPWLFWPIVVACSLTLTFAAYELAMRVLPVIWSWK